MNFSLLLAVSMVGILGPWIYRVWFQKDVGHLRRLDLPGAAGLSLAAFLIPLFIFGIAYVGRYGDTEILNGRVTGKSREEVSCSHSYECNCINVTSGTGKDQTTTRVCQTCYEHSFDVDWDLRTTLGDINIDRLDRQGLKQPPRWTMVQINEPVAKTHYYTNYIKNSTDSVFHLKPLKVNYQYPPYPEVYDYYRFNRVIGLSGVNGKFANDLNNQLNLELRYLGFDKQVNIIVVFTSNPDPLFGEGLRRAWANGKKNDVVVVMGVANNKPVWTRVFSLAQSDIVNIVIRDDLNKLETLDDGVAFANIVTKDITTQYKRKHMRDFEYLKYDFELPVWVFALCFILSTLIGVGVPVYITRK